MKLRSFLPILLTALFVLPAAAQDNPKEDIDFVSKASDIFRGRHYEYHLDSHDLKNSPDWTPGEGEPPLTIAQAVKIARGNFGLFVDDARGWEVSSLRLTSTSKHKWYYYVTVSCMKPVCATDDSPRGFHLLIKLDGTVMQPVFLPAAKPEKK